MRTVKPKIPFAVVVGIVGGLILMLAGAYIEGSPIAAFLNLPALLIVGGGTTGAVIAHVGIDTFLKFPGGLKRVIGAESPDFEATAIELVQAADRVTNADGGGLLSLEKDAQEADDELLGLGYQLLSDGTDEALLAEILYAKIDGEHQVIKREADIFTTAGGYSPTMGIIGTVMGLTHALGMLDQPELLGPAIAGAFMATLYGVSSANLGFLPIGNRLYALGREREAFREMMVTGLLCLHRGDSTRQTADKLAAVVPTGITGDDLVAIARGNSPSRAAAGTDGQDD